VYYTASAKTLLCDLYAVTRWRC